MRILNYVGGSRNYGDLCIQAGTHKALHSIFANKPYKYDVFDLKLGTALDEGIISYINNNYDLLLVGAGGMLMPGDGFETVSGWQFNCSLSNFSKLTTPVAFYGLGYNVFPYAKTDLKNYHTMFEMFDKAIHVSARDAHTLDRLVGEGFDGDIKKVADPAYNLVPLNLDKQKTKKVTIGVTCAGDRIVERGQSYWESVFREIKFLLLHEGISSYQILGMPHCIKYDTYYNDMARSFFGGNFVCLSEKMPNLYPEQYALAPFFVEQYKTIDLHVGDRWHNGILAMATNTPFAAVGRHSKVSALYDEANMADTANVANSRRIRLALFQSFEQKLPFEALHAEDLVKQDLSSIIGAV